MKTSVATIDDRMGVSFAQAALDQFNCVALGQFQISHLAEQIQFVAFLRANNNGVAGPSGEWQWQRKSG